MAGRIEEKIYFADTITFKEVVLPAGAVSDDQVAAGAKIAASKMVHKHRPSYGQAGTAVSETRAIHGVFGATGSVVAFKAGSITACTGNATISVDLKKNGTSILASPITLDSTKSARVLYAANIASAALSVGDWLEVVVTANAGTGSLGSGLFWQVEIDEDPQ